MLYIAGVCMIQTLHEGSFFFQPAERRARPPLTQAPKPTGWVPFVRCFGPAGDGRPAISLSIFNVKEIILLDEAYDSPAGANWDSNVSCGEIPASGVRSTRG